MSELWGSQSSRSELAEFTRQLSFMDNATFALKGQVHLLRQSLKTTPDDALQQKLKFLEGVVQGSSRLKTAVELKQLGIKEEYSDLIAFEVVDGSSRLEELHEVYSKMTQLLAVSVHNIHKILGTPTNWDSDCGARVVAPEAAKASCVVAGSAAALAGALALLADAASAARGR
ncbi:unnamed protein product [Symbiodinium natans]|uniref:Uncharacterized protein n=1 Tax=Symbiodinium natans TaxID=878477 RepID=A0A812LEM0_9DINO|nr:unnamed protein product [Symbiodinium natans]